MPQNTTAEANRVVEMAAGTSSRSSKYVEANDRVYGIVVVGRDSHSGEVDGLQCKFCVSFGREEKVGSKQKPTANVMSWKSPFRYDNIEKHLIGQHLEKWKEYSSLSNDVKDTFFEAAVSFRNTLQSYFAGSSRGERAIAFDLNKDIVEVLIGEMLFDNFGEEDHDDDEDFIEGDEAERRTILDKRREAAVTAKKRAMSVFKLQAAESNDEVDIYTVTIPKTKATVFQLVRRYVACGATFRMTANLIGAAYDVLANPSLRACGDHLVASYVAVQCAANFQRISDLLRRSWTFSIALDGATHQGTSYLDLRARVYDGFVLHNFHIYALPMFERHTGEVMFNMVEISLSVICPDWK